MKISKLMIGNQVIYNGFTMIIHSLHSPLPMEDKRYSDKELIGLFDGAGLLTVPADQVSGIPITIDSLALIDFQKDITWFTKGSISINLKDFRVVKTTGAKEDYIYNALGVAKLIHKLQNIVTLNN